MSVTWTAGQLETTTTPLMISVACSTLNIARPNPYRQAVEAPAPFSTARDEQTRDDCMRNGAQCAARGPPTVIKASIIT